MFVVVLPQIPPYFLRSSIFTADAHRASRFETREAALAAIARARTFHKARTIKALQVQETDEAQLAALGDAYHGIERKEG